MIELITTTRDTETREERILADTVHDIRATSTRVAHVTLVRSAAVLLGWSQAEVWVEVNRRTEAEAR